MQLHYEIKKILKTIEDKVKLLVSKGSINWHEVIFLQIDLMKKYINALENHTNKILNQSNLGLVWNTINFLNIDLEQRVKFILSEAICSKEIFYEWKITVFSLNTKLSQLIQILFPGMQLKVTGGILFLEYEDFCKNKV